MENTDRKERKKNSGPGAERALSLLSALLTGAAMAAVWGILSHALRLDVLFPNEARENMFAIPFAAQLVLYTVISPLAEEFLFRRLLYDLICRVTRWQIAAVLTSALFALWHGDPVQMMYAFPAGLVMQALRRRSGSMQEPVICHMGANLTAILVKAFLS